MKTRAAAVGLLAAALSCVAADPLRPMPAKNGSAFQSADVRALQDDDFANPMGLWVARGEALWNEQRGANSCAGCHGDAKASMKGVAARYPRYDAALAGVVDLQDRINACVEGRQGTPKLAYESDELLGLSAYVALQSRGMPQAVAIDGPARATWEAGRDLFFRRVGQLNLACHQCHDTSWGKTLLAEPISQGQPTGWPAYRLEWQRPGSLQRRLRACFNGVRADMPAFGSADLTALELYLAWRAAGLSLESPGVRR